MTSAKPEIDGNLATVCAWHADKDYQTGLYHLLGYRVSHGLCPECKDKHFSTPPKPTMSKAEPLAQVGYEPRHIECEQMAGF